MNKLETIAAEMQLAAGMKRLGDRTYVEYADVLSWAKRIEEVAKREAAGIVQIVMDAIVGYENSYPHAPNDEAKEILRRRVKVANDWLDDHGFLRIHVVLDEEDQPCL